MLVIYKKSPPIKVETIGFRIHIQDSGRFRAQNQPKYERLA